MQFSRVLRFTAASTTVAALIVWAQTFGFCQSFSSRPQVVVTKTDVYLLGSPKMIVSAEIEDIAVHPQGRYAIVFQNEVALPPGSLLGTPTTGAAALLLYDARLHKIKTLWERRADGGNHSVYEVKWMPGTDCVVVVTIDSPPNATPADKGTCTLLWFNFAKSSVPHTLATTPGLFKVDASPTKPLFVVQDWEGHQARIGSGLSGALGPIMSDKHFGYTVFPFWSLDGTTVYGGGEVLPPNPSEAKKSYSDAQWFAWDGKTPEVTLLAERPPRSQLATKPTLTFPIVLRTDALPVPSATKPAPVLHPLFLEAAGDTGLSGPLNRSVLVAPDADKSYLLTDQSAILYLSGDALYAVPLVRMNPAAYAQLQKAQAKQNNKP